jgi:hypothetical protein
MAADTQILPPHAPKSYNLHRLFANNTQPIQISPPDVCKIVSTDKQGKSGLGLGAQREAVLSYLDGGSWTLFAEYTEVESGKHADRPQLLAALAACKKHRAKLVIAKLDRLSRNLAFIATLMDSGVEFVAVDNPHANKPGTRRRTFLTETGSEPGRNLGRG